jgi:uncharacterized membrane protein YdbT with pleckstrin-like domain
MAEETLWTGPSSQWKNFGAFLLCILIVPIPWAIWRYLKVHCRVYSLTTERLIITSGIFNKNTETLELYRIRDMRVRQPFLQRLVGLEHIQLITADASTPELVLDHAPKTAGLSGLLRKNIELCREAKRVRSIDLE